MDKTVINQIKVNVMKKAGLLSLVMFFISFLSIGQIVPQTENCIFCGENILGPTSSAIGDNNTNNGDYSLTVGDSNQISEYLKTITLIGKNNMANGENGSYSIGLGTGNSVESDYSYIFGKDNIVEGKCGVAIGLGNKVSGIASVAIGSWCNTYRTYGVAVGMGCEADSVSTAIGFHALSLSTKSFTFGNFVKSTGEKSMTLGSGLSSSYLENNIDNSLMIGFKSDKPTFFVSSSSGANTTGSIGIGNVTEPEAKLHIKGDSNESADILLQPGAGYGRIYFGDMQHYIQGKTGYDFVFRTQTDEDFSFLNGNVGIGTVDPDAKLQVNGNIFIDDDNSGLILKSPDGQCWKGTIDDNGSFTFESIDCNLVSGKDEIQTPSLHQIDIFPNPAGNKLFVQIPAKIKNVRVAIYNEQGVLLQKRVLTSGRNSISLKKMSKGVIIVKVYNVTGDLISSEKIMHL